MRPAKMVRERIDAGMRARGMKNGGNSRYTAGAIRFAYDGVGRYTRALSRICREDQIAITDFGTYTD